MNRVGFSWAALRGVAVVVGMTACASSPTGPSAVTSKSDLGSLRGDWSLVSLAEAGASPSPVPSGAFAAGFGGDGDLFIEADCNVCSAAYAAEADGSLEVLGPIPCTLAYCTTAPLDVRFVGLLAASTGWRVEGSSLELTSAQGTLVFQRSED